MNTKKALAISLGLLLVIIMLGAVACALAGLFTLGWNVVGVAMFSIAVPISFLTALKGIGILYLILTVVNIVRTAIKAYASKMQMEMTMKAMQKFGEELAKAEAETTGQGGDILRHFRQGN